MLVALLAWWACTGGPSCPKTASGACVPVSPRDADGDGFAVGDGDCDDLDPTLTPADADGDGRSSCEGDCDEVSEDAALRGPPEAAFVEVCDNVDNDCNDLVDEDDRGVNACVESEPLVGTRWTSLDLVYVLDSDREFQLTAGQLRAQLLPFFAVFEGTDTNLSVADSRGGTPSLLEHRGRRSWSATELDADDLVRVVQDIVGELTLTSGRRNHPLATVLEAPGEPTNAGVFRAGDGAMYGVLVHTNTDEEIVTADQFLSEHGGRLVVFGPDPELACGERAAPILEVSAPGQFFENCGDHLPDSVAEAAAFLVPAHQIAMSYADAAYDVLPATRRALVVRSDGTPLDLGPEDLDWDAASSTVTVRELVWADVSRVTFEIQRVP